MAAVDEPGLWAVAAVPSPVLNTPDFHSVFGGADGSTLKRDRFGLVREVEFVAPAGTVFRVEGVAKTFDADIYRVSTSRYPYHRQSGYYIDSRFVRTSRQRPRHRPKKPPEKAAILAELIAAEGVPYVWGGNCSDGVPQMLRYYRPAAQLSAEVEAQWTLKGLDCSGLLYQATGGFTPRNAASLVDFGKAVPIAGLDARSIASTLRPLDLIVWARHVIVVYDADTVIESSLEKGGVRRGGLVERLEEILAHRLPVNDYHDRTLAGRKRFVVRRWAGRRPAEQSRRAVIHPKGRENERPAGSRGNLNP